VSGKEVAGEDLDGSYWYRNLRETVRFGDAVKEMVAGGHRYFVEASPHPVLTLAVKESTEGCGVVAVTTGSLRRDDEGVDRLSMSLAEIYVRGAAVDLRPMMPPGGQVVALPTYPFERQRYWLESERRNSGDATSLGLMSAEHPLLGAAVSLAGGEEMVFTGQLSLAEHGWLSGHVVWDTVLLPGRRSSSWGCWRRRGWDLGRSKS